MGSGDSGDDPTTELTAWSGATPNAQGSGAHPLLQGRYEILGLLGQGGMGSVYKARDRELDETVALKVLRPDTPITPRALERFRREVKLARRVTHKNVARTFDIGEHDGAKFLTMELVDGEPLSALLAREGKLAPQRAAHFAAEICEGLAAAHEAGVVHRDLKPDNVMLERSGRIVITDFGIARAGAGEPLATQGGTVGTPAYMAPEQVEGRAEIDGRADLYALGVMLFEMLTGRMPFDGGSPYAIASARLNAPPPNPRVLDAALPDWIADLVVRCLARRPDDRWQSAAHVSRALRVAATTLPEAGAPHVPPSAPWRPPDPAAATAPGQKTVAVLPFRNAGAPDDAYLAEGLTEDLIDTLSTTPGIKVRPRGMVEGLASGTTDPREVGRKLAVGVVVEGTLRRLGDGVRVVARVVSVDDGFQLWAKRFDRPASDLLRVSDEAAGAIAEALTVGTLGPARQPATDPRAIELYLRARAEFRGLWEAPINRAVELLEQAHRLAPADATILASYARARARRWYFQGRAKEGKKAKKLAERAIAEAPERGETWLALAQVRYVECDDASAARLIRTALSKSPSLADAYELLGDLLFEVGTIDEALARYTTALTLDPMLRTRFAMARALALAGRWDESCARLEAPAEDEAASFGMHAVRARTALWRGRAEPALASELPESLPTSYARVARSAVVNGVLSQAEIEFVEEHLARVEDAARFASFKRQLATELFCYTGDPKRAQVALHEAVDFGLCDENWMRLCPTLAPLRGQAPFERALSVVTDRAEQVRRAISDV